MLYYNQYHQNGKELRALKAETKILKEENESLKQSSNVEELNSSISSPISVTDTESDVPTNSSPQLPNRDDNANVESNVVAGEAKVSTSERRLKNDGTPDLSSKKATPSAPRSVDPSFKCMQVSPQLNWNDMKMHMLPMIWNTKAPNKPSSVLSAMFASAPDQDWLTIQTNIINSWLNNTDISYEMPHIVCYKSNVRR